LHWQNSHFQIRHFLAGRAHTPDGAYRVLRELAEDRATALEAAQVSLLRTQARLQELTSVWRAMLGWFVPGLRMRTMASLLELRNDSFRARALVSVAEKELRHIKELIHEIEPQRRFRHMLDHEADQAAQEEEWRLELLSRVENFMVSTGTIPPDQLETMRLHPAWKTEILPHMRHVAGLVERRQVDRLPDRKRLLIGEHSRC
jgi:hypothetical protein